MIILQRTKLCPLWKFGFFTKHPGDPKEATDKSYFGIMLIYLQLLLISIFLGVVFAAGT